MILGSGFNTLFAQWTTQPTGIEYSGGNVTTTGIPYFLNNELNIGLTVRYCHYRIDFQSGSPSGFYNHPCTILTTLQISPGVHTIVGLSTTGGNISNARLRYDSWNTGLCLQSVDNKLIKLNSSGNLEFGVTNNLNVTQFQVGTGLAGSITGLTLQAANNRQVTIMPDGSIRFWNGAIINPTSTLAGIQGPPGSSSPWVLDGANMRFSTGKVWIGSRRPTTGIHSNYRLAVDGKIVSNEIFTLPTADAAWADDVFDAEYNLKSLSETETYITKNHHLEGIPSKAEVIQNGIDIGSMDAKLLRKIEEQYLHLIRMQKELDALKVELNKLKK